MRVSDVVGQVVVPGLVEYHMVPAEQSNWGGFFRQGGWNDLLCVGLA